MPTWKEYYNKTYQVDPDDAVSTYLDSGPVYPEKQEKEKNEVNPEDTEEAEGEKKNFFNVTPKVSTAKNNINIKEASNLSKKSKKVVFDTSRSNKRSNVI